MGLSKSDLNGEVTVLSGLFFAQWKIISDLARLNNIVSERGDHTSEVTKNRGSTLQRLDNNNQGVSIGVVLSN